ncbi:MAG TPA: ABC transporter permease [Methanothrix sp.]|uniref:nickel ABC transporter permease n=1 Tax=Methanothrix sp. TaxID=90426 RepID=UPI002BCE271E|nr:nickel ABC transporter permease [Methanothrix sp.]MDI9418233.1 ABC transporter permease [Euryarchaeota archaeon]HON35573.1 ABC transporter permease [Methanothrix sp.]HRU75002.1 ABC transporter permease [Methanothrix sp.]
MARRVLQVIPAMLLVSVISFSLIFLAPGDPAVVLLTSPEGSPSQEAIEMFKVRMGMDQPVYIQYLNWLNRLIHGDLGYSYISNQPVADRIMRCFQATLKLSILSMIISLVISIPLGIIAAVRSNTIIDDFCRLGALIGVSIPNFWQAFIFIMIFSIYLDWLPVAGYGHGGDLMHMILPATVLGTSSAAMTTRLMRSSLLEAMNQDYITTARAKGLPERVVIGRHALRNALIPVVTMLALSFGFLLNGSVVIEWIFGWPGIGGLVVDSIYKRDYTMIQGSVLFIAAIFVTLNLIVDISYTYLDPRIRYDELD